MDFPIHETHETYETHESHIPCIHPDRRKPNYTLIGFGVTIALLILPAVFLIKTRAHETHETPVTHETHTSEVSPTPQNSLSFYITSSQQYLARAQSLAANTNQTAEQKQAILTEIQKSLDTINQGIKEYPNDDRGYSQRATIYQTIAPAITNAKSMAIADLKKACSFNPQNPDYFRTLGNLYQATGDLLNSASAYYNAYTLSPNDNQTLYNLANCLEKSGQVDKAVKYYDKLITLLPENDTNRIKLQDHNKQLEKMVLAASGETLKNADAIPDRPVNNAVIGVEDLPLQQAAGQSNLIIANPEGEVKANEEQIDLNAKSGEGTITSGQTEIIIDNNNIKDTSRIVVVPDSNNQGKSLFVKAKKAAEGNCMTNDPQNQNSSECLPAERGWFKVNIDSPSADDIHFNWWIVE